MANGYIRQSSAQIVTGNTINASDSNNEFNAIQQAMDNILGHTHDGTVAGGGGTLTTAAVSFAVNVRSASYMAWGNVPGTYNNGTSGVGATITATVNGALTIHGFSQQLGDRILLTHQTTQAQNGIYAVTALGDATHPYVLTRTTDFNNTKNIFDGIVVFINDDSVFASTAWQVSAATNLNVGTDAIQFINFSILNTGITGVFGGINTTPSIVMNGLMTTNGQVYLSANSAIAASTWTKIPFNTKEFDYGDSGGALSGYWDTVTNFRYTPNIAYNNISGAANGLVNPPSANLGGRYRISAGATLSAGTTIGIAIYKNGVANKIVTAPGPAAGNGTVTIDAIISLNGNTDYVEIFAFDSTAGNIIGASTATWASINYIGTSSALT